ncbi:MAG: hypothetical protein PQ612_06480 [Rickettsiales bacterium]|nr:hypothetical protein [Pseudomonadota bacterium]MDA0966619.1 hypothetical protein [Pseudomonadota bacterium]MDG4543647.1 hypothetical protein [Rickettsiales bacterium]MDG4545794.1 hypothetical protein [Rickettsiales bacterium]MDG4547432.1 hypothetical protein [Rickettsiales bacterium]
MNHTFIHTENIQITVSAEDLDSAEELALNKADGDPDPYFAHYSETEIGSCVLLESSDKNQPYRCAKTVDMFMLPTSMSVTS